MTLPSLLSLALLGASLSLSCAAADLPTRRSVTPAPSSLPAATAGALRILLVDDDLSDNNHRPGDSRLSLSDRVFRQLVADAVGGDAKAWEIETVGPYSSGPGIERLRPFSLIVWYTGASYGGNPDNTAVLSIQDEKAVRRYLEEVGGAVILVSPGYLGKVLAAGSTGDKANWPFLTEVMGVRGGVGLAQRFEAGSVKAPNGASFTVGKGSPTVESQFSTLTPEGAAAVFTTSLLAAKKSDAPAAVATANPYGRGRIVYVGFTFENLAAADLAPAFQALLTAARPQANATLGIARPVKQPTAAAAAGALSVQVSGTAVKTIVSWTLPTATVVNVSIPAPAQAVKKASKPAAPAPGPIVKVERQKQSTYNNAYYWEPMEVRPSGAMQVVDGMAAPGTTRRYRVTVTEPDGAIHTKEVQYDVPPIQDPASVTATVQSDGSVIVSWPPAPGVTKYRVQTIPPGRHPWSGVIVDGTTEWRSTPLDGSKKFWAVSSLYEVDGQFVALTERDMWPYAVTESIDQYYLTSGTFTIHTGNDNKEILSNFEIKLYINGGAVSRPYDPYNGGDPPNPLKLQDIGYTFGSANVELKVNSSADLKLNTSVDFVWLPQKNNLANIQRHGLRIVIKYSPNFFLDAWKIDRVTFAPKFQSVDQISTQIRTSSAQFSPGMDNKVITFSNVGKLLTETNNELVLITNGALQPVTSP